MRAYGVVVLVALFLMSGPLLADDDPDDTPPKPARDRLASVPMECMMPALPSPSLDVASSPIDTIKFSITTVSDFVQDAAIYAGCITSRTEYAISMAYWRFSNAMRNKFQHIRVKEEKRFDEFHDQ